MDYWKLRDEERKAIELKMRREAGFKGTLTQIYEDTQDEVNKELSNMIERFADEEGLSMAQARKKISRTDVDKYGRLAERYVEEQDFSPTANRQMRRYNVTMRTNHLELTSARLNLQTTALANKEAYLLQQHLMKSYMDEAARMSGILGQVGSTLSESAIRRNAEAVAFAEFRGTVFSERVWQNQFELQNSLEQTIRRSIMRGQNPRNSLRELKENVNKEFKNKKYAADRIALTEVARVQGTAQLDSYVKAGYEQYQYMAEPSACDICASLGDKVFNVKDAVVGENMYPMHPFCMCSTLLYSREFDEYINE